MTARCLAAVCTLVFLTGAGEASAGTCDRPLTPGDQTVQLTSAGRDRPFLLYVPKSYDGHTAVALALNLHPTGSTGPGWMDASGLRKYADQGGFIVAAPSGGAIAGGGNTWVVPGTPPRGTAPPGGFPDDVRYLRDVIAKVQSIACQDHAKVFATGYSGGGRMTSAMACYAADVITGVVPDAGLRAGAPRTSDQGTAEPDPATCNPARPLPVIALHGTADGTNPYDGGGTPDWQYTVPQAVSRWAQLLGCQSQEVVTSFSPQVDELTHPGCRSYATIMLYRVAGGGHDWFSGEINAGDVVMQTIQRYALQAPSLRGFVARCRHGKLRVTVRATVDSPLKSLALRLAGKTFTSTTDVVTGAVRLRHSGKARATATDQAGLSSVLTRKVRPC